MDATDNIKMLGPEAIADYTRLCTQHNVESFIYTLPRNFTETHLKICETIWKSYHTTNNFKIGDKVYLKTESHYIRATITYKSQKGYELKAFKKDTPNIHFVNIWDKDLIPRKNQLKKKMPKS
jgi:hypothetical protein